MEVGRAAELAQEGLDLWRACRLADAAERYKQALTHADPGHHATPGIISNLPGFSPQLGMMTVRSITFGGRSSSSRGETIARPSR